MAPNPETGCRIALGLIFLGAAAIGIPHRLRADRAGGRVSLRVDPAWFWIFIVVAGSPVALTGLDRTLFGLRPLDVVRASTAVTLMWASVEKWAYPQWADPLLAAKPAITMGASPELFMQAAGVIEFTLAFALISTPLVRRSAARRTQAPGRSECAQASGRDS